MSIAIISHPDCVLHDMGEYHPERPSRITVIQKALEKYAFSEAVDWCDAPLATEDQLLLAHPITYINHIKSLSPRDGLSAIDEDTLMNAFTYQAALRSAGAGILAVDLVMSGKVTVAFCNVRPPGHHAEINQAMGFCFFNNIAIATNYALSHYGLKRIAIIDFDAHHGNGTQSIFQDEERVLFCSSFEHPFYPGYDAAKDNSHILNVPLASGTTGEQYRKIIASTWLPALEVFKPELILFSAGFDSHTKDPLANINLEKPDYIWLTEQVAAIAKKYSHGRMISFLEGGYNPRVLAECVPAHVQAMIC